MTMETTVTVRTKFSREEIEKHLIALSGMTSPRVYWSFKDTDADEEPEVEEVWLTTENARGPIEEVKP